MKSFNKNKDEEYFFEYFQEGNNSLRLGKIYIFSTLCIAGLFAFLIFNSDIPIIYFYITISTIIIVPLLSLLSIYLKKLKLNIVYTILAYFLVVTYLAFQDLVFYEYDTVHFIAYFTLYGVSVLAMQMVQTRLIYIVVNFSLIIYGYLYVDDPDISFQIMGSLLFLFSAVSMVVIVSRSKLIIKVQDYSIYLKNIVNNSGVGFILFKIVENDLQMVDYNKDVSKSLNEISPSDIQKAFLSKFHSSELLQIILLKNDQTFSKQVEIEILDITRTLEVNIATISIKNKQFRVANIIDISDRIKEQKIIAKREKKYRNLYNKNLAGVFTLNNDFEIKDYNDTFYQMFEGEFRKGDVFTLNSDFQLWKNDVLQSISRQDGKNFHVKYTLKNKEAKWFNFNWYEDKFSGNIESTIIDLTETYKVTEALRHNETKFRQIYSESNDCILLLNNDKIIDVNKTGIQLFGLPKRELLKYNLWELSENLSEESKREYLKHKNKLNLIKNIKFSWNFLGNGNLIESEASFVDILIDNQNYTQCVIRDLTERNKNQRDLQQTTTNLQSILENTPEGIFIIDNDFNVLYCNPKAYEMMEISENDAIDFHHLFYQKDQETYQNMVQEILKNKEIQESQLHLIKSGKRLLEVEISIVQSMFEGKESLLHIIKDVSVQNKLSKEMMRAELAEESNKRLNKEISERIKAERSAQEQYLRTKAIFESSSNTLLLTLNKNYEIVTYNSHSKDYFSQKVSTPVVYGQSVLKLFEEIYPPNLLRLFRKELFSILKGEFKQVELKLTKNNQIFWLDLFLNPIFDIEGKVIEISMVAHDVTEKKSNEIELTASLKEKEILLKEIHHRVKNNLQIISSILNLQSSFIQDKKTLEILEDSRNRIRSMAIIHENLYHTANFSSIDFSNYLTILSTNLVSSYRLEENSIDLVTDFEAVELVLDQAIPCGLIINELVTNALKYAFKDMPVGEVYVSLKMDEDDVFIIVKDNGVGLPKNFNYLESDSLGLQLVVTLVEQLDGKLEIKETKGTEFNIRFKKEKL